MSSCEFKSWILLLISYFLQYLNDCVLMKDHKITDVSLQIFATLAGSPFITDVIAQHVAQCVRHCCCFFLQGDNIEEGDISQKSEKVV